MEPEVIEALYEIIGILFIVMVVLYIPFVYIRKKIEKDFDEMMNEMRFQNYCQEDEKEFIERRQREEKNDI